MSRDLFHATVYLHFASFFLAFPLAYSQRRLGNTLLFTFALPLAAFHAVQLHTLLVYGSHIPSTTPFAWCVVRKALFVYTGQAVYWFSALIAGRLWMIVSGRELVKERAAHLERVLAIAGLVVPLVPALLVSLPQVFVPPDPAATGARDLYRCSQGYIARWQVLAAGAAFSIPPTAACTIFIAAIIFHIVRLVRHAAAVSAAQRVATIVMGLRVLLLCAAVGVVGGYYIVADFYRYAGVRTTQLTWFASSRDNDIGHVLISLWGLLYFLIFGTTAQSRRVLLGMDAAPRSFAEDDEVARRIKRSARDSAASSVV